MKQPGPATNDKRHKMKLASIFVVASTLLDATVAFSMVGPSTANRGLTPQFMFTGAGEGMPAEDNPEDMQKMEEAAKSMGMSLQEYKLGINARIRLTNQMSEARISGGDPGKVSVERDAHNPPQFLEITITDQGKALGKEAVSKELVSALKSASEASKTNRAQAQKDMMTFISDEMKKFK